MPETRNNDNVRVFGSKNDNVWIAPFGTPAPPTLDAELPAPWVAAGWLSEDGIGYGLSTDSESFRGHQGRELIRTEVTATDRSLSFTMLETNPLSRKLYHGVTTEAVATATPGMYRQTIPGSVDTVVVSACVFSQDGSVIEIAYIPRLEITEREDITISATEITAYGITGAIIGDYDIYGNAEAFLPEEEPVTP